MITEVNQEKSYDVPCLQKIYILAITVGKIVSAVRCHIVVQKLCGKASQDCP